MKKSKRKLSMMLAFVMLANTISFTNYYAVNASSVNENVAKEEQIANNDVIVSANALLKEDSDNIESDVITKAQNSVERHIINDKKAVSFNDAVRTMNVPLLRSGSSITYADVSNEYVRYLLDYSSQGVQTTGGDPNNSSDNNKTLVFGSGGTSFTTIRIDGDDYYFSPETMEQDGNRTTASQEFDDIIVTRTVDIVENPYTNRYDTVDFSYSVENTSSTIHSVGIRMMFDTQIGDNDNAPFRVPGIGNVTTETDLSGTALPEYWQAFDSVTNPSIVAQGTLQISDSTDPDRIRFTNYGYATEYMWDYSRTIGTDNGDSAVCIYWNEENLAGNTTRNCKTYYGLGELSQSEEGDIQAAVSAVSRLDIVRDSNYIGTYSPNPFTVTAYITNGTEDDLSNVKATIDIPEGLSLYNCQSEVNIGTMAGGNTQRQVSWQVMASTTTETVALPYSVTISGSNFDSTVINKSITVPKLLNSKNQLVSITPTQGTTLGANPSFSIKTDSISTLSLANVYYAPENSENKTFIGTYTTGTSDGIINVNWNTDNLTAGNYDIYVELTDISDLSFTYKRTYTLNNTPPSAAVLTGTAGNLSANLSWTNADSDISYYKIYRGRTGESYRYLGRVETTSYTDSELSSEITYNYYVVSVNQYGNSSTSNIATVTPNFVDTVAPVANVGFDMAGIINEEISFTGSNSSDNVGITSYLWNFGDGTTSTEPNPTHTYTALKDETNEDYDYTATLTVTDAAGNSSSSSITVTVYPDTQIGTLNLTVKGSDGRKLSNAYVFIDLPGAGQKIYMTNSSGIATLKVMAGNYNISAYYQGYVPNEGNFAVTQYTTTSATLTLTKSDLVTQEVVVTPMTRDEIIDAGIDTSDPDNQYVYSITTTLVFEQKEITLPPVVTSGTGTVYSGGSTYYYSGGSTPSTTPSSSGTSQTVIVPKVIANEEHPEVPPTLAYLVIPSTVSWLKEFFNVQMILINQAPEAFVIQDSVVTLELPEGLSLANTAETQSLTVDLGNIAGQSTATAEWIIRGDVSGTYDLDADFSGILMPFEADVNASFQTEEAITVYGEKAVKMYVYPEDTAYIGQNYYAMFQMMNQSNKTIYDFEWKFGTGEGTRYELEDITDQLMLPFLHDGDSIYVEELPPYTYVGGIYETVFEAEGDPERNYYSLLETLFSTPNEDMPVIATEVVPIPSNAVYGVYNGAYIDQTDLGYIRGQQSIGLKMIYNSMTVDYLTAWGKNVNYMFGYSLDTDNYGRYVLTFPNGGKYYFMPRYAPANSSELTPEEVTVNINTMILEGYTPITRGSKNYTLTQNGTGFIVETGNHVKYFFDSNGKLTCCEDKTGKAVNITETSDSITVEEENTGKTMVATIGSDGFVSTVTSDTGTYTLTHDEDGNVTEVTDPLSQKTSFEYTEDKLTKKSTENAQNVKTTVFENEYDSEGRLSSRTDGKGHTITYSYDTTSEYWRNIVAIHDRMGYNKTMVYNRFGELVKTVDALGNITLYTYDGNGNRTSITDPNNNTVIYKYDDYDNLLEYTDAEGTKTKFAYDNKSNLLRITKADNSTIVNTYDNKNQMLTSTDERGNITSYSYDADGNITGITITSGNTSVSASYAYTQDKLTSFTDFRGNTTRYAYDPDYKHITSVTDALNNVISYQYDGKDRLTQVTYPDSSTELYTYDERDNMTSYTDKNGNRTENTYDANNNLATVKDAGSFTTAYSYDNNDRLTEITDYKGNKSISTYDAADNLLSESDFNGNVTTYTYDDAARLLSETTADTTTAYGYYKTGELKTVTDDDENTTWYFYDAVGNVYKVTDAKGNDTVYTYDPSGNLASVTTPEGHTSSFTYDFRNNVLTETDPKHNTTTYAYDENGNLTSVTNALSKTTTYAYDALNRRTSKTDANGNTTTYTFDGMGNNTVIAKPLNVTQRFTYDSNGNILTTVDSNNVTTSTTTYNYNNAPLTVTDALNNTIRYTYDGLGNKTSYTTARNNTYLYEYDKNGNLTKETDPLGGIVEYTYNAFDTVTSFKDANNNTTTYNYNTLNRLTGEEDATGETDSSIYDAIGLLTRYTNKRGQNIGYTYDADGNMTGRTTVEGNVTYVYDANGNLTEVTDSSGTIYRTYDNLNRITSYTDTNGNTILYDYDDVGNLTQLTYPDNKIVRYSYNANNQLAAVQDWANRITIYTYDNNGRLATTTRPDGSYEVYSYDNNGRLSTATDFYANGNALDQKYYEYDADGNIVTETSFNELDVDEISVDDAAMSYSAANRLTNFNGTTIPYDADGNSLKTPLGENWGNLAYDNLNQLTDVTISGSAISFSYTYDAEGNRTSKTANGITTNFVVDTNAALSQVLMSTTGTETTYYVYGLGLISQENSNGYKLFHYDYRGSTVAITDLNGNVTDTVFYDAYGNIVKRTGTTETPFLYVGKYGVETDECGLYYMRARYYNPQIQRFINVDPIRDGYNWYSYVECNPINRIDYNGESWIDFFYGIVSAVSQNVFFGIPEKLVGFSLQDNYDFYKSEEERLDFYKGRFIGDLGSFVSGIHGTITGINMIMSGALTMWGSGLIVAGTGGMASPIAIPVGVVGTGEIVAGGAITVVSAKISYNAVNSGVEDYDKIQKYKKPPKQSKYSLKK